jgi:hypothetical protein
MGTRPRAWDKWYLQLDPPPLELDRRGRLHLGELERARGRRHRDGEHPKRTVRMATGIRSIVASAPFSAALAASRPPRAVASESLGLRLSLTESDAQTAGAPRAGFQSRSDPGD